MAGDGGGVTVASRGTPRFRDLRLQYLAGLGLKLYESGVIYADMQQAPFRFPTDVFRGSDKTLETLEQAMRDARP